MFNFIKSHDTWNNVMIVSGFVLLLSLVVYLIVVVVAYTGYTSMHDKLKKKLCPSEGMGTGDTIWDTTGGQIMVRSQSILGTQDRDTTKLPRGNLKTLYPY